MIPIRKYLSAIIAAILVSLTFYVILEPGSGVAYASSPTYCWLGYCGNDTIYMTTGTTQQFLNNITDQGGTFEKTSSQHCFQTVNVDSTMAMAIGRHNNTSGGYSFCEGYRNGSSGLQVFIPVALSGFTRTTNLSQNCALEKRFNSIWSDRISSVIAGLGPGSTLMCINRNNDGGMNTSGGTNDQSSSLIPVYISIGGLAIAVLAFVPGLNVADVGLAYSMLATGDSILSYEDTTASSSGNQLLATTSNSPLWQDFFVNNGTQVARTVCVDGQKMTDCNFTSFYSSQERIDLCIPSSDFSNSGYIAINGSSCCSPQCASLPGNPVMNASLKIPIMPAYTLDGRVNYNGCPDINARVHIEQTCEKTNEPSPEYVILRPYKFQR